MPIDDYLPPHEARSGMGQLGDAAGGRSPMVAPTPMPNAMQGSPGYAAGAASPPTAVGADDPASLAIAMARMANELFHGTSISPTPAPAQVMTTTNTTSPGSPGLAPSLMPSVTEVALPVDAGVAPSPPGFSPHAGVAPSPPGDPVPTSAPGFEAAPDFSSLFRAPITSDTPYGAAPDFTRVAPGGAFTPSVPPIHGAPSAPPTNTAVPGHTPTPPASPSSVPGLSPGFDKHQRKGGLGSSTGPAHGQPSTATNLDPQVPFGSSSFGHDFDAPVVDHHPSSDTPYFVPAPEIRDLGGNAFDPYRVRKDFPILEERVHNGKRLVWLDNAATTQKPQAVIDRLAHFYAHENSNIHRAAHTLAARATDAYEQARETTRRFLNAPSAQDIVFVRGATEGINLIAQAWGRKNIQAGDEIVITHLEHHANIVPWQMLCAQTGARLRVAPVDDRGDVILEAYDRLLSTKTKLVAFTQVSNALGTITPAREMVAMARRHGATVMVDGAQAVSHMRVDVQALDCDFYVFSGHKVFAPTGIGAVYGKKDVLAAMPPWQGGGNMIADVTFERTVYNPPPFRFEAGTGNIADAAGMGAALDYVMRIGMDVIDRYEHDLHVYATQRLAEVPGLRMLGTGAHKASVLSFVLDGQRTEDVGAALDKEGIAVRSGHHCAQPILRRLGVEASVRASLAFYNVCEDVDALVDALKRLQRPH